MPHACARAHALSPSPTRYAAPTTPAWLWLVLFWNWHSHACLDIPDVGLWDVAQSPKPKPKLKHILLSTNAGAPAPAPAPGNNALPGAQLLGPWPYRVTRGAAKTKQLSIRRSNREIFSRDLRIRADWQSCRARQIPSFGGKERGNIYYPRPVSIAAGKRTPSRASRALLWLCVGYSVYTYREVRKRAWRKSTRTSSVIAFLKGVAGSPPTGQT
jgi:hypothetical protein